MNKLLLLALIMLLIVLAFGMGLFNKDDSQSLSQYVPDSVEQLFTDKDSDKNASASEITDLKVVAATDAKEEPTLKEDSVAESETDTVLNANTQKETSPVPKIAETDIEAQLETLEKDILKIQEEEGETTLSNLVEIPDSLIEELQQDLLVDQIGSELENVKTNVVQVDAFNEELQEKLDALTAEFDSRTDVLKEIETQIKNLNN